MSTPLPMITAKWLSERGACSVTEFMDVFGYSTEITPETLRKAAQAGLDVGWLVYEFIDEKLFSEKQSQVLQRQLTEAIRPVTRYTIELSVTRDAKIKSGMNYGLAWDEFNEAMKPYWKAVDIVAAEALIAVLFPEAALVAVA